MIPEEPKTVASQATPAGANLRHAPICEIKEV